MRIVQANRFKNWGELHKEWTEAGFRHQEPPHTGVSRNLGYSCRIPLVKPLLNHRQRQRRLTWAKEKKNWTVAQWSKVLFQMRASFVFHLETKVLEVWRKGGEAHSPSCMKSSVKFPQSVMIWGAMSSAGVGPLCFLKTTSLHPFTKKFWSTSFFLLLTSFMEMLISFSSRIWHLHHTAKSTKSWLNDHGVGVLDWPANSPDLKTHRESMGYCQEEDESTRDPTMQMSWRPLSRNLGFHTTSAVPQNWSPPCHAELRQ